MDSVTKKFDNAYSSEPRFSEAVHVTMHKKKNSAWNRTSEEIQQQDEGVFQKKKKGWWMDALRLTRGRSIRLAVVGFDSLTCLWRASHQMQPHTRTSNHPSLSPTFFPLCILSEQILFFHRSPWGTTVLTSILPERKGRRQEMPKTCLTFRTQNLEKPSVRMKGQAEAVSGADWPLTAENNRRG